MGLDRYADLAEQARRGQWRLGDLPWDEPVKFSGSSRRERLLCKLDLVDAGEALYHFKLGARKRMAELHTRAWTEDHRMAPCVEWMDADELRQLQSLRRLLEAVRSADAEGPEAKRRASPRRMWRVSRSSRPGRTALPPLAVRMLVDEAAAHTLFRTLARDSHVPLVRAVTSLCAEDDDRHRHLLKSLIRDEIEEASPAQTVALQGIAIAHIARLQSALRPYFRSFASVTHSTTANVASEIFRAIAESLGDLGPAWVRYPTARIVHGADRSPWMLWLLR